MKDGPPAHPAAVACSALQLRPESPNSRASRYGRFPAAVLHRPLRLTRRNLPCALRPPCRRPRLASASPANGRPLPRSGRWLFRSTARRMSLAQRSLRALALSLHLPLSASLSLARPFRQLVASASGLFAVSRSLPSTDQQKLSHDPSRAKGDCFPHLWITWIKTSGERQVVFGSCNRPARGHVLLPRTPRDGSLVPCVRSSSP